MKIGDKDIKVSGTLVRIARLDGDKFEFPADPEVLRARRGEKVRRAVLGDAHVERALANATAFTAPFQDFLNRSPWGDIWAGLVTLRRDRVLWLTVIGLSYFWFLGSLLQLVVILFATEVMKLSGAWVGALTAFAAIGIGIGSLAAGRLSGDKVELGLAPIGAIELNWPAVTGAPWYCNSGPVPLLMLSR